MFSNHWQLAHVTSSILQSFSLFVLVSFLLFWDQTQDVIFAADEKIRGMAATLRSCTYITNIYSFNEWNNFNLIYCNILYKYNLQNRLGNILMRTNFTMWIFVYGNICLKYFLDFWIDLCTFKNVLACG